MNPVKELLQDRAFSDIYIAVLQGQLFQQRHVLGGAEPRVVLAYHGTGTGAPAYVAVTAQRWQDNPKRDWHIVAEIDAEGVITLPADTDQK